MRKLIPVLWLLPVVCFGVPVVKLGKPELVSKQVLLNETLNDMVFVKGGTYMMGTDNKQYKGCSS